MDKKMQQVANDHRQAGQFYVKLLVSKLAYRNGLAYDIVTREIGPYEPDTDRDTPIYRTLRHKR